MRSKHILVILLLAAVLPIKAQKLAVGLDAVWLATGIVNAGAEMTMGRASTIGLSVMAIQKPWIHHDMKGIALQPEWRYYLSGRPMYHHFIGVGAITGTYNFTFNNKIYNGSAAGLGLTFGYVIALGERFNIDLVNSGHHGGSHPYLTDDFLRAILVPGHKVCVDAATALNTTVSGVYAHMSAMKDGESLKIPIFSL